MKILVACEASGTVRRAFAARGYEAWSCDLRPADDRHNLHIQDDVRNVLHWGWDMLIVGHPPCTRLCNSGVRWLSEPPPGKTAEQMQEELREGAALFSTLWNADIPRVAIENPVMHKHAKALITNFRPHSQSVQPYQFGHRETKRTCLWLRGLPNLVKTTPELEAEYKSLPKKDRQCWARVHNTTPGDDRWIERSKFFSGIADAMADQWGEHIASQLAA